MPKLLEVKPLNECTLYCRYSDSTEGNLNIGNLLSKETFSKLRNTELFNKVGVDPLTNDILWDCGISLCHNAAYRQITLTNLMKRLSIDVTKI